MELAPTLPLHAFTEEKIKKSKQKADSSGTEEIEDHDLSPTLRIPSPTHAKVVLFLSSLSIIL